MLKRITLICHYNLYESKLHFGLKFAEALQRKGVEVQVLDVTNHSLADVFGGLMAFRPELTLSFNSTTPDHLNRYFWERTRIPHLSILVDPAVYYLEMTKSEYSLFSCVDELDVAWLQQRGVIQSFFLPHAIERELCHPPEAERPYDVVLLGSCYDAEAIATAAKKLLAPPLYALYEKAVKRVFEEENHPFEAIVEEELLKQGMEPTAKVLSTLCSFVDFHTRGKERLDLVRGIKETQLHIFGTIGWEQDFKARSWQELLSDKNNIIVHPPVSYAESLSILKQAKISLNSMPFFKKGTHERIFASLAAGSVPLTTRNLWLESHFKENEELLLFNPKELPHIGDRIQTLLAHPKELQAIAARGQAKTLAFHTWDQRAETLLSQPPEMFYKDV